jgi:hypothetical protein
MKTLLIAVAGLLLWSAAPIWFAWTLYQMFILTAPFWSTILYALVGFVSQVFVAVVMYGFAVASIGNNSKAVK